VFVLVVVVLMVVTAAFTKNAQAGAVRNHGELQLINQAEKTGNSLSGAVFGIYRVTDNRKMVEITTNADGRASLYLEPGEYYLRELKPSYGYLLESARIYFDAVNGETVKVEITSLRDMNIRDINAPGGINLPKTGEDFPIYNYIFGILLLLVAVLSGITFLRRRSTADK
jgi:LPXTG-motif cell wall-anchored protein